MSLRTIGSADFIRANAPWLLSGLLLSFSSSFGQTYFIALFAEPLRAEFNLSHGEWGRLYTIATLCSAGLLVYAGKFADVLRIRSLALIVYGAFILVCIAMAHVNSVLMLGLVLFGLRFCGQGMLSHVSMTSMGRWFARQRGKAVAFAALGYPIGEALFPFAAVALAAMIGWRETWLVAAGVLGLLIAPLLFFLLRHERVPSTDINDGSFVPGIGNRHWQRGEVLRHPVYWALMPGVLAPPFISTALFFHQTHIVQIMSWDLVTYAAAFPLFSGTGITAALVSGFLVDRYGTASLLPFYLLPLAATLTLLGTTDGIWVMFPYLMLIGATTGVASTLLGALWAELYGTRHLGAIRAMAVAGMVLGTALGPGITGSLMDTGIGFRFQCLVMAAYLVGVSVFFWGLSRKINGELSTEQA
jgi:MFS family permease